MNRPRVEMHNGALNFIFETDGGNGVTNEHAYPVTVEGATEFVIECAGKLEELKHNPELMKMLGTKAVGALVDLFVKKGS